jgi:hypothetical protein
MNTTRFLWFLAVILLFSGCQKEEDEFSSSEVESYISLLRSGNYNTMTLPEFKSRHIPALLEYRNNTQMISNFPRNPISSWYQPEVSLGLISLWTIESIRLKEAKANLIMGFPSMNCAFRYRNLEEFSPVTSATAEKAAAAAYADWWSKNKSKAFSETCNIDPLAKTEYRWH